MKKSMNPLTALALSAALFSFALPVAAQEEEAGFKSIFNGRDLSGWDGNPKFWSVRDGAITGQTTAENPTKGNTFLIWRDGELNDFELRLSFRIIGGNSGIQYRSEDKGNWVVHGYQADFEAGRTYSGILYEEGGRGILAQRGQFTQIQPDGKIRVVGTLGKSEDIQAVIKNEEWNDYVIIARGNQLFHVINGRVTAQVMDDQPEKRAMSGILAMQLHAGPSMIVQFKNVRVKSLAPAGPGRAAIDQMQGDWRATEMVWNGEKLSAAEVQQLRLTIKGNRWNIRGLDENSGMLKVEGAKMDAITDAGDAVPGIIEVSGDTLRICYAVDGASRPREVKSERGSDHVLAIYKRN